MNTKLERIVAIIMESGLSWKEFGENWGYAPNYVSCCLKKGGFSEHFEKGLILKYYVRKKWLETGEGEKYYKVELKKREKALKDLTTIYYDKFLPCLKTVCTEADNFSRMILESFSNSSNEIFSYIPVFAKDLEHVINNKAKPKEILDKGLVIFELIVEVLTVLKKFIIKSRSKKNLCEEERAMINEIDRIINNMEMPIQYIKHFSPFSNKKALGFIGSEFQNFDDDDISSMVDVKLKLENQSNN